MSLVTDEEIKAAHAVASETLLGMRNASGHWEGRLSSSALSTATAILALHLAGEEKDQRLIREGSEWLLRYQNADGGWGDTTRSFSNISTTLLCWATLRAVGQGCGEATAVQLARRYVDEYCGGSDAVTIANAVEDRYGRDRTFSVPILMVCAIGGLLGDDDGEAWKRVLPLPFELATLPRGWFAAVQLPVVSYALPALIAIGFARFTKQPPPPPLSWIRERAWPKASKLLAAIQPDGGGFLEATPLTSFVTIALAAADKTDHPVVGEALGFLRRSARNDGGWPIDTNLATWATTLAVKALGTGQDKSLSSSDAEPLTKWLLDQQYREIHPYTDAPPGGWAWTDLPGGVPDGDDTPGALLALLQLAGSDPDSALVSAAEAGVRWLVDLQNRDGGIPTFCRGWGALPFDRSSPDLTAHTLRAWSAWRPFLGKDLQDRIDAGIDKALGYLANEQAADGSWVPLWFGNQHLEGENNPVYGTAMVAMALAETGLGPPSQLERALDWLRSQQHADGSWGGTQVGEGSIEETALALDALAVAGGTPDKILRRGATWLLDATDGGRLFRPSPIGFYFAKLWYFEDIYPVVWAVSALGRVGR